MYDPKSLQSKYKKIWQEHGTYEPDLQAAKRPYYNLMMFPYPSAEGLHVGNMYAFTGADAHGRFRRMQGFDVFEPIGLDGFGIHSENYAIKMGKHPADLAKVSQEHFYDQLSQIGNGFAWNERLETYDPAYYRWTQWLFIQMFRHGLAYKGSARVNWCPSCKTVLADEQVEDGRCERCKSEVERREMSSWYFQITEYADRLLENIDNYHWTDAQGESHTGLQWPSKVTTAQKNWIGRKEGLAIDFPVVKESAASDSQHASDTQHASDPQHASDHQPAPITVWTMFWETIFGATYLVVAPEYEHLEDIVTPDQQEAVAAYVSQAFNKSEQERLISREKTGVFTGSYVTNPANGQKIPVWVADYVLADVGTGAVMGVPAHDQRDFEFAQVYDLPVIQVVAYEDSEINARVAAGEQAHEAPGQLINSQAPDGTSFNGQSAWEAGKQAIKQWLIEQGKAQTQRHYHLRDWLISRQRYWGPPIPLVYCEDCARVGRGERPELPGWYTVNEAELPVELPYLDEYQPTGDGTSPLDSAPDAWKITTCPACGGKAKRETDVSDTFLDSSWYFLRYPSAGAAAPAPNSIKENADPAISAMASDAAENSSLGNTPDTHPWPHISHLDPHAAKSSSAQGKDAPFHPNWYPVDAYIGGAEHAVLHLLYARFVTMALHDWGYLPSEEPFPFLFGHGLIIKDGAKMSKSRGNVVNPDEYIAKFGADALRTYLMFLGPYDQGGDFRDTGMHGMHKWLNRVWEVGQSVLHQDSTMTAPETTPKLRRLLHQTIAANTSEMAQLKYNTCIARLMELVNLWKEADQQMSQADTVKFWQLLAPFAPYLTEDLYQQLQAGKSKPGDDTQLPANTSKQAADFTSIHHTRWPEAEAQYLVEDSVTIAVQVNGKLRATLTIPADQANEEAAVIALARELADVKRYCQGREIKKSIYVPGRIVNFVV